MRHSFGDMSKIMGSSSISSRRSSSLFQLATRALLLLLLLAVVAHAAPPWPSHNSSTNSSKAAAVPQPVAYLVQSMAQPHAAHNSSFSNLRVLLSNISSYRTIVLTEDYAIINPREFAEDPVRLSSNLLITSSPGERNMLTLAFLVGWPLRCRERGAHDQQMPTP